MNLMMAAGTSRMMETVMEQPPVAVKLPPRVLDGDGIAAPDSLQAGQAHQVRT